VTAAPGLHGEHEVTFVIQAGERTVFFGGDSLRLPELDTLPERFGRIDLAILPTNGLCVRPMNLRQVVMDSGRLGHQMITKGDQDPRHYVDAVARLAPAVDVRLVLPGIPVPVP